MANEKLNPLDCPEDRIYFLNESNLQFSDLSDLGSQELVALQGDTYRMLEMIHLRRVGPPSDVFFIKRALITDEE